MKKIGLIGRMRAQSTQLYCDALNRLVPPRLGDAP